METFKGMRETPNILDSGINGGEDTLGDKEKGEGEEGDSNDGEKGLGSLVISYTSLRAISLRSYKVVKTQVALVKGELQIVYRPVH
ncbi:hypothetical protein GOBAR_AA03913 [Gossypium barbadense]|uniref:Uncharacterized protein n=1 Tax=Gossypium barbadense TaxID=3634 RepID=A0A2P5YM47_GOSBA|nr:hypothetical protein GOBAR_AA03913 [Gossypium barbadense]